jgi:anti-anti-sigma factor
MKRMVAGTGVRFTETRHNGTLVFALEGPVDSALSLEALIERVDEIEAHNIVVVLDRVIYINSEGFGALIRFSDRVAALRRNLFVVGLQSKVRVVFDTLGVGNLLNILPTLDVALDRIRSTIPQKN